VCVLLYCVGAVHLGRALLLRVCYCNVLVQYIWLKCYYCVCVFEMCWCGTVGYRVTIVRVLQ